jgi:hypothetical protein
MSVRSALARKPVQPEGAIKQSSPEGDAQASSEDDDCRS